MKPPTALEIFNAFSTADITMLKCASRQWNLLYKTLSTVLMKLGVFRWRSASYGDQRSMFFIMGVVTGMQITEARESNKRESKTHGNLND